MKKIAIIVTLILAAGIIKKGFAQTQITTADATDFVGKKVEITGTVDQVKKTEKIIYLNMDGKYPDNMFTAVILAKDFGNFSNIDSLPGKKVIVSGTIKLYKDKPEIVLEKQGQLILTE